MKSPLAVIEGRDDFAHPYLYFVSREQSRGRPFLPAAVDIKVVSAVGPYERVQAEYHPEKDYSSLQDGDYRFMASTLSPATARRQGKIAVTVERDDVDIGLRFEDAKGDIQRTAAILPFADEGPVPLRSFRFMSMTWPESAKRILLDYRAASVVVFRNVSLRPGHETNVAVDARQTNAKQPVVPGSGPVGRHALSFDGADDRSIVPPSPSLELKPPFSIEVWLKPDPQAESGRMCLLQKGREPAGPDNIPTGGFFMEGGRTGTPQRLFRGVPLLGRPDGGVSQANFCRYPVLDRSGWCHLLTRCADKDCVPVPDQPLLIGKSFFPRIPRLKGEIAEIRIWSKSLTDAEAHWYASASLTGNEPNLVACWTFEEGNGQIVRDISPNANHARLGNSTEADGADPQWVRMGP